MKNVVKATVASLLASTVMATAGGIERTSQSVDIIFEEGSYSNFRCHMRCRRFLALPGAHP